MIDNESATGNENTRPAVNSNPFNLRVIEEFRANGGVVGGDFEGISLLLLSTRGARSGLPRTTPLVYLPDGDRLIVFASNGGAPTAPAWYHNILAHPESVQVEAGTERFEARATALPESEHDELWRRQTERDPNFATFRTRTRRVIPVIALTRKLPEEARGEATPNAATPNEATPNEAGDDAAA
ncbi:nitroreductase family deazaflavin-dependent oxidoreductase [Streptomyces sp. NPDC003077]|uniref:nitroreductase family deazaflavin-dependent oxidoreductase n=1 Tax=Streptomyces sp. NPDC003077 TaxID=3154443 RepID=UPI0033A46D73